MGLFDNLFLDKNTPMAINIGDPSNGDAPIDTPVASSGGGGGGGSTGGGTGGNDGKNPPTPTPTLSPLSKVSGGNSGTNQFSGITTRPDAISSIGTTADSNISFDIGGDMAFMTGDTSGSMIVNMENIAPSSGNISPSQSADQVSFIVSGIPDEQDYSTLSENLSRSENTTGSIIELTENTPIIVPDITTGIEMPGEDLSPPGELSPIVEIQASSILATESPLTNLMSGFDTIPSISPITPPDMTPPTPITDTAVTLTDSLFSLMDTATGTTVTPPIPEIQVVTEKIPEAIMPLPSLLETTSETILPVIETTPLSLIANIEPSIIEETDEEQPMNEIGKGLARMTRSPRLQGKLIGFISGLEEISKEEELIKNEKRKQIESYQIRIAELKVEYETRIHALELEEADLDKQIALMDQEGEHITQVIDGFKKELEVV